MRCLRGRELAPTAVKKANALPVPHAQALLLQLVARTAKEVLPGLKLVGMLLYTATSSLQDRGDSCERF